MGRQSETFFLIVFLCLELFIVKCRVLFYELGHIQTYLCTQKHVFIYDPFYLAHACQTGKGKE